MDNDLGRLVDGREARRPHSALPSGTRLCYPFAAGGSKENDDDFVDDQDEEAPSAGPPVASSAQIQTHVSSFFQPAPASAADVARQLLRLTDEDILDFTSSRNTLQYQPILAKLLCMQTSLAIASESSWAKMKGYIRRNCKHTLPTLRLNIIAALQPENIPLTLVQKWFRKMRDYMVAYEAGADGKTADKVVKQYKSHRQCFDKTPAGGSSISESTRLVLRSDDDSIIDLTVVIPTVEMVESAARE